MYSKAYETLGNVLFSVLLILAKKIVFDRKFNGSLISHNIMI